MNTIRNIALYVARVGVHPPLGPLQIPKLGEKRIETSRDAIKLIEASLMDTDGAYYNPDYQSCKVAYENVTIQADGNDEIVSLEGLQQDQPNGGQTQQKNYSLISQEDASSESNRSSLATPYLWSKQHQASSTTIKNQKLLTVEDTLFKHVHSLPFHIDAFRIFLPQAAKYR